MYLIPLTAFAIWLVVGLPILHLVRNRKANALQARWVGQSFSPRTLIIGRRPRAYRYRGFQGTYNSREYRVYYQHVYNRRASPRLEKTSPRNFILEFPLGKDTPHLTLSPRSFSWLVRLWDSMKPYEVDRQEIEGEGDEASLMRWKDHEAVKELVTRYRARVELIPAYSDDEESRPPVLVIRPPFFATSLEEWEAIRTLGLLLAVTWDFGRNEVKPPSRVKTRAKTLSITKKGLAAGVVFGFVVLQSVFPSIDTWITDRVIPVQTDTATFEYSETTCEQREGADCLPRCTYVYEYDFREDLYSLEVDGRRGPNGDSCREAPTVVQIQYPADDPSDWRPLEAEENLHASLRSAIVAVFPVLLVIALLFIGRRGKRVRFGEPRGRV